MFRLFFQRKRFCWRTFTCTLGESEAFEILFYFECGLGRSPDKTKDNYDKQIVNADEQGEDDTDEGKGERKSVQKRQSDCSGNSNTATTEKKLKL